MSDLLQPSRKQISEWAKLTQKKYRRETRQYLIEGEVCTREATRARANVQAVLLLPEREELALDLPARLPCYVISADAFLRIAKVENCQGVVAVGGMFDLPSRQTKYSLAVEQVSDPGNCGALIRVADFFGAGELFLGPDSAEIWNSKVVRGSMGSIFHQPVREQENLADLIHRWPGSTVALTAHGGKSLRDKHKFKPPVLLVLGNETRGINPDIEAACSDRLTLPPVGQAESLNLVTAAAVFAFALS